MATTTTTRLIQSHRCRLTGTVVDVVFDSYADPDQPWETICVDHGTVCSHPTRALAVSHAADPTGWCEDCMGQQA